MEIPKCPRHNTEMVQSAGAFRCPESGCVNQIDVDVPSGGTSIPEPEDLHGSNPGPAEKDDEPEPEAEPEPEKPAHHAHHKEKEKDSKKKKKR